MGHQRGAKGTRGCRSLKINELAPRRGQFGPTAAGRSARRVLSGFWKGCSAPPRCCARSPMSRTCACTSPSPVRGRTHARRPRGTSAASLDVRALAGCSALQTVNNRDNNDSADLYISLQAASQEAAGATSDPQAPSRRLHSASAAAASPLLSAVFQANKSRSPRSPPLGVAQIPPSPCLPAPPRLLLAPSPPLAASEASHSSSFPPHACVCKHYQLHNWH